MTRISTTKKEGREGSNYTMPVRFTKPVNAMARLEESEQQFFERVMPAHFQYCKDFEDALRTWLDEHNKLSVIVAGHFEYNEGYIIKVTPPSRACCGISFIPLHDSVEMYLQGAGMWTARGNLSDERFRQVIYEYLRAVSSGRVWVEAW